MSKKDSHIEWIGKIPSDWDLTPIKAVAPCKNEKNRYNGSCYIALEHMESNTGRLLSDGETVITEVDSTVSSFADTDVLFGKLRPYLAKVARPKFCGQCSTEILVLSPTDKLSKDFLFWYLLNPSFIDAVNSSTYGAKMPRANWNFIGNCAIPVPTLEKQREIAKHLDDRCGKVDSLIDNLRRQIENLTAYKHSLITEYVTRGEEPSVKMKCSGVDVFPDVPIHWSVQKTLNLLAMPITDGPHTTPELFSEGIPFVSAEAVSCGNGSINFNHIRGYISQDFYDECCKKYVPQQNDIYMIKSGATTGRVAVVDTDRKFTIWSPLAVFRCNPNVINFKFLYYFLQSDAFQRQVQFGWTYGTQQNIGMRTLERLKVFVPPLDEQRAIVKFLDSQCHQMDRLISTKKLKIESLEKYRKSLIYEYVTRKKEVS